MTDVPEPVKEPEELYCAFCGGQCFYRYSMDEYDVWQCRNCKTGCVWPMPGGEVLKQYYDGFSPHLDPDLMPPIRLAAEKLFPHLGLRRGNSLAMLDIGGGGGFFAKAFEELGYGESTYVDLDSQSCNFAQNALGLKRIFNCDAVDIVDIKEYINTQFDFIYCRHVIEHLIDPTAFMRKIINYLGPEGLLVVQVPNGESLEYLAYTHSTIRNRFSRIRKTSNFSKIKLFWIMISGGMLHGIDPPRHLWAITKEGIKKWASKVKIACEVHTYNLGDPAYSPYYRKGKGVLCKVQDFIGQKLLSMIHGGTHLVAILKRSVNTD